MMCIEGSQSACLVLRGKVLCRVKGLPLALEHSQMLLSFDDYADPARTSPLFNNLPEAAAEEVVEEAAPATCAD